MNAMQSSIERAGDIVTATCSRIVAWTASAVSSANSRAILASSSARWRDEMKGVNNFIQSIRMCESRETEDKIINKELAKIRNQFHQTFIDGHTKKKNVCKLLYIFLLGRKIDFGHLEALSLLSSNIHSEKLMGYHFLSIAYDPSRSEITDLLTTSIKSDLESRDMKFVRLALQCIANISLCSETGNEFFPLVYELVESRLAAPEVKQSAILCYLNLYRTHKIPIATADINTILCLMSHEDLGVVLCVTSLIDAMIKNNCDINENEIVRITVTELWRILNHKREELSEVSTTHPGSFQAPWLMINLFRILQNFGVPKEPAINKLLQDVLMIIVGKTEKWNMFGKTAVFSKGHFVVKHLPGSMLFRQFAVFLEAVGVIIQCTNQNDLWAKATKIIDGALFHDNHNLKYLALDSMSRLCVSDSCRKSLKSHQSIAIDILKSDCDVSVQHKAVNFLYNISDASNVDIVVEELFGFLKHSEYSIKEAVALQIAIIADQWFPDYFWYVNVMMKLISIAGEFINDQLCSKVINVVMSNSEVQRHAASSAFNYLNESLHAETLVRAAGYFLGEFGHTINDIEDASSQDQFQLLRSKFSYCNNENKAILLTSFMKLAYKFPQLRKSVIEIFQENSHSTDLNIQIRSAEYLNFLSMSDATLSLVFQEMPPLSVDKLNITRKRDDTSSIVDRDSIAHGNTSQGSGDALFAGRDDNFTHKVDLSRYCLRHSIRLVDDSALNINMVSKYQGHTGRLTITYVNKTSNILPLTCQIDHESIETQLVMRFSPIPNHLPPKKEFKQELTMECVRAFSEEPTLFVEYNTDDFTGTLVIRLPVFVNKFFEPAPMSEEMFKQRWISLECNGWMLDETVKTKKPIDANEVKSKLRLLKMAVLQYPNSNPEIIECAALFSTLSAKIGCLLKMKIDVSANQFHLTVMSRDITLTKQVMKLLTNILN